MALSAFDDKANPPDRANLDEVLGSAAPLWSKVVTDLGERYPPLTEHWGFSGRKWGWSLRLKRGTRTIVYMTPCTGFFLAGFALGEKAVAALPDDLPDAVRSVVDEAPRYAEGRGVRLEVAESEDVAAILALTEAKMST